MRVFSFVLLLICIGSIPVFAQADDAPLWLRYSAISPDGKTIAFCYKGDIYTVPTQGGKATALTLHEARDFKPVWSPDSKSIAFASNRYGNYDVFTIPAEGGKPTRLTFHSDSDHPSAFTSDGKRILFQSSRFVDAKNMAHPNDVYSQIFSVATTGGLEKFENTNSLERVTPDKSGNRWLYYDRKGYEDEWRKHHTSSVTRDLWLFSRNDNKYSKITSFEGEDRDPVWSPDEKDVYYLSEKGGTFNVWKFPLAQPDKTEQVTKHSKHPVRFLSMATDGTICYSFNGEIYTKTASGESQKVRISIATDERNNAYSNENNPMLASEMAISANGKEVAFIVRGEVFVASAEFSTTKRITNTPEQERSVSFSPDGRSLVYAAERNGSWNIYESKILNKTEPYMYAATQIEEKALLEGPEETFQPKYSPDGKEVAYLEERTTLKVLNLESKKTREVMAGTHNYSYADGDQWYDWAPDSKWFLVTFLDKSRWRSEVGLVEAVGGKKPINLTVSGYNDDYARFMMNGKMMIWFTDRRGMRSHGSWGSQGDVYGMFFTQAAMDTFSMNKAEADLVTETQKLIDEQKAKDAKPDDAKKDEKKDDKKEEKKEAEPLKIEMDGLQDRIKRLTIHSSNLGDAILTPSGDKLYYLSAFEKGYDLWVHEFKEQRTKIVAKLEAYGGQLAMDKEGKYLFMLSGGNITRIDVASGEQKPVMYNAQMQLKTEEERAYFFEHIWRQVDKKFYVKDLHGVDWPFMKKEYARFLPHINNYHDFSEMTSELLGELNASHTGCFYFGGGSPNGDQTASLGAFYDHSFNGNGIRIEEIMEKGPLHKAGLGVSAGCIIEKIDGQDINANTNFYQFLNQKAGKYVLLSILDPKTSSRKDVRVKAIYNWQEGGLLYQRWLKKMREMVDKRSNGRLAYVHVEGMDESSFRHVYSEVLGRYADKEGLIVDTRFNGGGWLHDDLATFLSGKRYAELVPRGQKIGSEPEDKWCKPSLVLMGEGNYSDAHLFPWVYKELKIGKLVGMPVPGTGTAVWWETLMNGELVFGIPQVGVRGSDGKFAENAQLEPDVKVAQSPDKIGQGIDEQIDKAVDVLLGK